MVKSDTMTCERETGIPAAHQRVFQSVANATGNIIASRAVGIYATGLILENYASKGFHNKAKSCDWGPMAGFVLDDPRFTKVGGTASGQADQRKALVHAAEDGAVEVPLFISDARRTWLLDKKLMTFRDRDSDSMIYAASSRWASANLTLTFRLKRERIDGASGPMWAVQYRRADRMSARDVNTGSGEWSPVLAMRDPMCALPASNYRAATTGDYDLFMIFARKNNYSPDNADKRMVGVRNLETAIRAKAADTGEDRHLGNLTPRIAEVRTRLNAGIHAAGYTGGNMVHHSDEGGRPFVNSVDLPVFAVVPDKPTPYLIRNVADLREFVSVEAFGYAPVFNPGWMREMVSSSAAHQHIARAALNVGIRNAGRDWSRFP